MRRALVVAAVLGAGCAQDITAPDVFNLDRPSAVTFACWGDLRVTEGQPATADQELVRTAIPVSACQAYNRMEVPEGQEEIDGIGPVTRSFVSMVLQPTKGSVALVEQPTDGLGLGGVVDADPFTPGRNAVPIGTLPVDLATSTDGCYALAPNAGSCDLSVLDIDSAFDHGSPAKVSRVQLVNGSGDPLLARPAAIVAEPPTDEIGFLCPDRPSGVVYIAYPDCNWVAAIDPGTGEAVAGIRFGDGTVEITDGAVVCADQCGEGAVTPTAHAEFGGPGRPVALHMSSAGDRLYVGAENVNAVTIVELDGDRLPSAVSQVDLDGEVGVLKLASSQLINMGGSTGLFGSGSAGQMRFVYAVATDATVRVAEVENRLHECDTQVDPRYLQDVRDVSFLSCMPVGDLATPPRRPDARSPGIHIPRVRQLEVRDWEGIPLDVAIAAIDGTSVQCEVGDICPLRMIGHFAFITAVDGVVYLANIDDDRYPDFESSTDPASVHLPLSLAHQLRDFAERRDSVASADQTTPDCGNPTADIRSRGPRLAGTVARFFDSGVVTAGKSHLMPTIKADLCTVEDTDIREQAYELSFFAESDVREAAFPDMMSLQNETIRLTWEGQMSLDSTSVVIDGPTTRVGTASTDDGFRLSDDQRPFCRMGVQPYDIIDLSGCDPSRGNIQCGLGETCFVHPDTPAILLGTGVCVPEDEAERLAGVCADFMTSRRRYTVTESTADEVVLRTRRRVLDATPIEGCVDTAQCQTLFDAALELSITENPVELRTLQCDETQGIFCPVNFTCENSRCVPGVELAWTCEEDPSRRPGKSWCQVQCDDNTDCIDGDVCSGGFCVEGPVPPQECVDNLQRYFARVGEAFALVGEKSGFRHNIIADNDGTCIEDTAGNPLEIGRVPLNPPACTADGFTDLTPNPCSTTVSHTENVPDLTLDGSACSGEVTDRKLVAREDLPAVRIITPGARFHLVNLATQGDGDCSGDLAGELPPFPTVHAGAQVRFELVGAFIPLILAPPVTPTLIYPSIIAPSPDGTFWVLDQGDRSAATQGQILRLNPSLPDSLFAPSLISTGQ